MVHMFNARFQLSLGQSIDADLVGNLCHFFVIKMEDGFVGVPVCLNGDGLVDEPVMYLWCLVIMSWSVIS